MSESLSHDRHNMKGLSVTKVTVELYKPTEHGVVIKIYLRVNRSLEYESNQYFLNLHGKFWSTLPAGIDKVVKWGYLPLNLKHTYFNGRFKELSMTGEFRDIVMEVKIGSKDDGQFGISHKTVMSSLEKLVQTSNQLLELEFLRLEGGYKQESFFSVFTTPEMIVNSINTGSNALYTGNVPSDIRAESVTFKMFRWILLPTLFFIFTLYSVTNPDYFTQKYPSMFFSKDLNTSLSDKLGIMVNDFSTTWNPSLLHSEYSYSNSTTKDQILKEAALMLKLDNITEKNFLNILEHIKDYEGQFSLKKKIAGFYDFANILWLFSIVGILGSIGPALFNILKPLRESILKLANFIWHKILIPCHSWGVFEILAYITCTFFITEGYRYSKENGFFIALMGVLGVFPCLLYSFLLHSPWKPKNGVIALNLAISICLIIPSTYYYESHLLAWLASFLGFYAFIVLFEEIFNFKDRVLIACRTSFIIGVVFIALKAFKMAPFWLKLFSQPVSALSSHGFFICLLNLIWEYYPYYQPNSYNDAQREMRRLHFYRVFWFLVFSIGGIWLGTSLHLTGLRNISVTYLIIFFINKFFEFCNHSFKEGFVAFIFCFSVFLFQAGYYLNSNRDFVILMFDPAFNFV